MFYMLYYVCNYMYLYIYIYIMYRMYICHIYIYIYIFIHIYTYRASMEPALRKLHGCSIGCSASSVVVSYSATSLLKHEQM